MGLILILVKENQIEKDDIYLNIKTMKLDDIQMIGPYTFNEEKIDSLVKKESIGNYNLGGSMSGFMTIQYTGRSDTDLNAELKARIKMGYKEFEFRLATSPEEAYMIECLIYHAHFRDLQFTNEIHPGKPAGNDVILCPRCGK